MSTKIVKVDPNDANMMKQIDSLESSCYPYTYYTYIDYPMEYTAETTIKEHRKLMQPVFREHFMHIASHWGYRREGGINFIPGGYEFVGRWVATDPDGAKAIVAKASKVPFVSRVVVKVFKGAKEIQSVSWIAEPVN